MFRLNLSSALQMTVVSFFPTVFMPEFRKTISKTHLTLLVFSRLDFKTKVICFEDSLFISFLFNWSFVPQLSIHLFLKWVWILYLNFLFLFSFMRHNIFPRSQSPTARFITADEELTMVKKNNHCIWDQNQTVYRRSSCI